MTRRTKPRIAHIGRRLGAARLQRGLSQGAVARRAGLAPSYLSRIENGRIQPTFPTLQRIARALKVDLAELAAPGATLDPTHGCPVTPKGHCLLDLIRPDEEVQRTRSGEYFSPREIRLLRSVATWLKQAPPDRVRALEILLGDLQRAAESPDSR